MPHVVYYRDGRGVVSLQSPAAEHIRDGLQTAASLVCTEAAKHQHWGTPWTVRRRGAHTQCQGCGQTAVITRLAGCLVVDSFLHTPCRYDGATTSDPVCSETTSEPDGATSVADAGGTISGRTSGGTISRQTSSGTVSGQMCAGIPSNRVGGDTSAGAGDQYPSRDCGSAA